MLLERCMAYLKLETVARGLGFTTTQNISGREYINIRWNRVDEYLNISRRTYSTDLLIRTWFSPQVGKEGSPFRGGPDLGPRWNSKYDYEECDKLNNESLSSLGQCGGWLINEPDSMSNSEIRKSHMRPRPFL